MAPEPLNRDPLDIRQLWPEPLPLAEALRGPVRRGLAADAPARARIARALGLDDLLDLQADMRVKPWLDGVEIEGEWRARVLQTCGVTLDPFESELVGEIRLRAAPEGSPALGALDDHELDLDPDAEDPPDVLERDQVDLGAYVVEDLSLAIDPFPRKPGVAFEAPGPESEPSPFAVLAKLKGGVPDA